MTRAAYIRRRAALVKACSAKQSVERQIAEWKAEWDRVLGEGSGEQAKRFVEAQGRSILE